MAFFSIMVQGTTSDAGKSTLVTGLCRLLKNQGYSVAPFKPQNMALNSAVTPDGKEIGRAQAVQAYAAGLEPHVDMNPILLKPNTDIGAQVIIHGQAIGNMNAVGYHEYKTTAKQAALDSFYRLQEQYDVVVTEGAGSPAEINLRDRDIANMGFAEAVDCPVIIIADIDKGGVFAHLVGTLDLLSPSEQDRVIGFVINRFRGDIRLLQSGLDWLEERTGKPVLGVLPYLMDFHLEAEDAVADTIEKDQQANQLNVVIPILPRTSNHTDWDALRLHPNVNVTLVRVGESIPPADLVILPGSKSVQADLAFLRQYGWSDYLDRHLRYGGKLLGICGGYQMLGKMLHDPDGLESDQPSSMAGFGYLPMSTTLAPEKQLKVRTGVIPSLGNTPVKGYEIHAGVTTHEQPLAAFSLLENVDCSHNLSSDGLSGDGAISADGQIIGTYLHGLFDQQEALAALLTWAGAKEASDFDYEALRERDVARLAASCEAHLDMESLIQQCQEFYRQRQG